MPLQLSTIALMFLSSFLCLPPYLAMQLFQRSLRRARRHGLPIRRFQVAIGVCIASFIFNLGVFALTVRALHGGFASFGQLQAIAIAFAWIAFWTWLILSLTLGRRLGRGAKDR